MSHMQKKKNEPRHRPYTLHKNQLKMDHKPKCKTMKLLEYHIEENVGNLGYGNDFLDKL